MGEKSKLSDFFLKSDTEKNREQIKKVVMNKMNLDDRYVKIVINNFSYVCDGSLQLSIQYNSVLRKIELEENSYIFDNLGVGTDLGDYVIGKKEIGYEEADGGYCLLYVADIMPKESKDWHLVPENTSILLRSAMNGVLKSVKIPRSQTGVVIRDEGKYASLYTYPRKETVVDFIYSSSSLDINYDLLNISDSGEKLLLERFENLLISLSYLKIPVDRVDGVLFKGKVSNDGLCLVGIDKGRKVNLYL